MQALTKSILFCFSQRKSTNQKFIERLVILFQQEQHFREISTFPLVKVNKTYFTKHESQMNS